MPKKLTLTKLKKKLDTEFSKYVRLSNATNGMVKCVTCGAVKEWNRGIQAGHYVSRRILKYRYDEGNVFPQCVGCNMFKEGNMVEFTLFMQKRYGMDIVEKLSKGKQELVKFDRDWYEEKIRHYQDLNKNLLLENVG